MEIPVIFISQAQAYVLCQHGKMFGIRTMGPTSKSGFFCPKGQFAILLLVVCDPYNAEG